MSRCDRHDIKDCDDCLHEEEIAADKLSSPAGETPAMRQHKWNKDGERCEECGDKDWMGGPCKVPTGGAAHVHKPIPNWDTIHDYLCSECGEPCTHPSAPEAAAAGEERICAECKATLRRRAHFWEDHKGLAHHYCGGDIKEWRLHVAAPIAPAAVSEREKHQCPYCGWSSPCPVSSKTASAEGDGWIAVTPETLPTKGSEILFNVPHCYGVEKGIYVGDRWVSDRTSSYNDEVSFTSEEITHWRPLPAPPVNEETE